MKRPPERIIIPVPTLRVPCAWSVGRTTFYPGEDSADLIADTPPAESPDDFIGIHVREILASAARGAVAVVLGPADFTDARRAATASLSALRLFQLSRSSWHETTFGLPGEIDAGYTEYVSTWQVAAFGGKRHGPAMGWAFDLAAFDDWQSSAAFQYLSGALCDPKENDGAERAVRGALLLDRATLEHHPDLRVLGFASALEAWLLNRSAGPQTLCLARHVSWFGCGAHNSDLCGRSRPICPYLHLSPDRDQDRRRLNVLRGLGNSHVGWRCSEWHRVMDWYDSRSAAAHGRPDDVDPKHAEDGEFWITHYLMEAILIWLRDHPIDPIGDLTAMLDSDRHPANWDAMVGAIDSPDPPEAPPLL